MNTKISIFLSAVLFMGLIVFTEGCDNQPVNSKNDTQDKSASSNAKQLAESQLKGLRKEYFPLAIGNSWSYRCTIREGLKPLFSLQASVEKSPSPYGPHREGSRIWNSGFCSNARSGIETYAIFDYDQEHDAFKVRVSDGAIDDRKYSLQQKGDVYWRYNEYGVFETVRAYDLGETILVHDFLAFLVPGEGLRDMDERMRDIQCGKSFETVEVPAGNFTRCLKNIVTQQYITTPDGKADKKMKVVSYFAPGVGLVKETQYDSIGQETYSLELTDFSIRKPK